MTSGAKRANEVLIGGREKREIFIADYDPAWPVRFEAERARIEHSLGSRALKIDHVGSTSVPGLAAKPIIDIDVSVTDPDDEPAYLADLEEAGYVLRVREPGHRMLRTPQCDVHVHICGPESEWAVRHVLFRDWLRISGPDRTLYEATKRELAQRDWDDMNDYADAKTDVIDDITGRAQFWATDSHSHP